MNNDLGLDSNQRVEILKQVSIFSDAEEHVVKSIVPSLEDLYLPAGAPIFRKGEKGNSMYIIVQGEVRVHDGLHTFTILKDKDSFGEYSVFDSSDRTASATCNQATHLLRLEQKLFQNLLIKEPVVMQGILKALIKRVSNKDILEEELARSNAEIRAQKEQIEQQNQEITTQRNEIQQHHRMALEQKQQITDSIQYAQRIQAALLPQDDFFEASFPEHFILYKPRDIVSGDFYWAKEIGRYSVFVVADCTGHGVPGAFMSMLGISYLNEIVSRRNARITGQILNELRSHVKKSLHQTGKQDEQKDGMDMAVCTIDTDEGVLYFSGAHNYVYIIRKTDKKSTTEIQPEAHLKIQTEGEYTLFQLKGSPQPVGIYRREVPFETLQFSIMKGDRIYLFSDGFSDQKGGGQGRKFMNKGLKLLLLNTVHLPMLEQKKVLKQTIEDWMKPDYVQVDDMLIMGICI